MAGRSRSRQSTLTPTRPARATEASGDVKSRQRVVIETVEPQIDCGRFPIKRVVSEEVVVTADAFAEGHDAIQCALLYRSATDERWIETPMQHVGNDRWRAGFAVSQLGEYRFTVVGWMDEFRTWRNGLEKKVNAGQDVSVDLLIGAELVEAAQHRAQGDDARYLDQTAHLLHAEEQDPNRRIEAALADELLDAMARWPDRRLESRYERELIVHVDRPQARFSAWYEMFPRSAASEPGRHGTFADVEARLPYIASMGFDILYLPPIHPIGRINRKGRNNRPKGEPGDIGSPWAIGAEEGGHKSIHPDLGTLDDFRRLVNKAKDHGLEIALDVAFQCAPDHPYVTEHPEWFRRRPDGTVQYAENPPKKYEDIYPFDFETESWESLWEELESIFLHWIDQGVKVFRVDNPHTKPFAFWEWCIGRIRRDHPDVIFLSEAFTRPKVMHRLAKLGFNQSYTYFAWKNTRHELIEYFTELTQTKAIEYFRANVWPNTPDILNAYLVEGGRPAFMARLVLAGTIAASYGMYGPAFELGERVPREPGSEEYLNSEKYELRHWDIDRPDSLRPLIARVNQIRRDNPALHDDRSLRFHDSDNEMLLCYSKSSPDGSNVVITVINLDPHHMQSGWVELPLSRFNVTEHKPFHVHDLLTDQRYTWRGRWNYIELNPHVLPAHVFSLQTTSDATTATP